MGSSTSATVFQRSQDPASAIVPFQLKLAGLLMFVLLAAPRARIVIGAPLYLIDVLAVILILSPLASTAARWRPKLKLTTIVVIYTSLVIISELRGMIAYGTFFESVYMMSRFIIATSMFFVIPRLVTCSDDLRYILIGLTAGALTAAMMVIMYSVGFLRPYVMVVFRLDFVNPGWQGLIEYLSIFGADSAALRGRSLIGAATMTAGFLAIVWPLTFITYRRFANTLRLRLLAFAAIVVTPLGILMTYGRSAWLMVATVVALIAFLGVSGMRKLFLMLLSVGVLLGSQLDLDEELFYTERVLEETRSALTNLEQDESAKERILSYSQPFEHAQQNPSWLLFGAGRAGSRVVTRGGLQEQLYDEGRLATHSGFAIAYYSFGFVAAFCQCLLVLFGFRLIISRMLSTTATDQRAVWQVMLMSWTAMTIWWLSGHGMVGEPRGVMLYFTVFGLLVSFEKLRQIEPGSLNRR